tara:strand:+ start:7163 stop:7933 length:771 start_codon:yes stop_codon:yes gene_type:complete
VIQDEIILSAMLGMLTLALALVFIFMAYQRRLLRQQREHQQKESEHQQELLRANFMSQEKERNRIGKDLHDEVGVMLTTAKLYVNHLSTQMEEGQFYQVKDKAVNLMSETMNSMRRISQDLRPVVLERLGLENAIGNLVEQVQGSGALSISFSAAIKEDLSQEFQLNWYRIIQELINNTVKHAQATHISIQLQSKAERLVLVYEDNGIGLTNSPDLNQGLGFRNLKSRLSLMEGTLEWLEREKGGLALKISSKHKP